MLVANIHPWLRVPAIISAVVFCIIAQTAKAEPKIDAATAMIKQVGQHFLDVLGPAGQKDELQLERLTGLLEEAINEQEQLHDDIDGHPCWRYDQ